MATPISPENDRKSDLAVLDREYPEYASGANEGSRLATLSAVQREAAQCKEDDPVPLVCRSGKRAAQTATNLERLGFQNVNVLHGGFEAWEAAGLPIQVQQNKPGAIHRHVSAIAGGTMMLFTLLGLLASPWFFAGSLFIVAGLPYSGLAEVCSRETALEKLPWNQASRAQCEIQP